MDITAIIESLQQGGGAAAAIIAFLWAWYEKKDKDFWRTQYINLRDERDQENMITKKEQKNRIAFLKDILNRTQERDV